MKEDRLFARISAIIPITWLFTFLVTLSIGAFQFGHFPVYGKDPDPSSFNSVLLDVIHFVNLLSFFISFFALPAWIVLTIHLLINKAKFRKTDMVLHISALISLLFFFVLKYVWTTQFLWHND